MKAVNQEASENLEEKKIKSTIQWKPQKRRLIIRISHKPNFAR